MTADGIGKMVDVLVADNSIYIKGVSIDFPDAWIKGDINGDKVSFTSNQYMGQLKDNFIYMMASYNVPGETWELRDEMVFDYDADAKTLTSAPTDFMLINASQAYIYFSEMYVAPKFFMQTGEIDPQPLNPVIYSFTDRLSTEGYSWLDFTLSNINADDKVLDPANLYYEIRLDGKVATFNQMDYMFMPEYEMSQFPYEYTDGFDFIIDGSTRKIYFYRNDFETIGLQLFNVVNGEKYASDIVTYNILTGETTIESDSAEEIEAIDGIVISENYYDLNGREVVNPENGIYLRKVTYNNGTSKVFKAVKR